MTLFEVKESIITWRLSKDRAIFLTTGLSTLLFLELVAKRIYRPYIYSHNLFDFHIADTLGNSLGTIAGIFIIITFLGRNKSQYLFLIKSTVISFIFYEIFNPLLGKPIDPWDIVATILSGGFCFFIFQLLYRDKKVA
jgi:uncharacterized membrane protein